MSAVASTAGLYQHAGVVLVRAAAAPLTGVPDDWPNPGDARACLSWLAAVWSQPDVASAVAQASPSLAERVAALRAGRAVRDKGVRRAALATARYLLRATGRPTPFGLFAGVAPVEIGSEARVRWATEHRSVVRADTQWLAEVIDRLEATPGLLERLDVVVSNQLVARGRWREAPHGPDRVRLGATAALDAVRQEAIVPVRCGVLAEKLAAAFASSRPAADGMLAELVRQGVLITCLRAPFTVTDPLGYLVGQLHAVGADDLPEAAAIRGELDAIERQINDHNSTAVGLAAAHDERAALADAMRQLSPAQRSPLAVDLRLDCDIRLPRHVVGEVERAAGMLLRLARQPGDVPAWRAYHQAFVERYGTGTLVPVLEVVNPDAGLGYPATYPGSMMNEPAETTTDRDRRLFALAWQTVVDGSDEIVLTDRTLETLAGDAPIDTRRIPPHVEVAARIQATSEQALTAGAYTLRISPARAGGVLTSRFTPTATGTGLEGVYRDLPAGVEGALRVQMSFPPAYPHGENILRIPAYLPHVLSLGEHRTSTGTDRADLIGLDDVAVTATADRLYLVSLTRRQVIESQVFHALALDKQAPPLARFLAHLNGGFTHGWTAFDWGPVAGELPYLPRVCCGRAILSPARWRLTNDQLPDRDDQWPQALMAWRTRWRCPPVVELRDDDRSLRLDLDQPLHAAILHAHLARHDEAVLAEASPLAEFGWLDGHVHEIVLPLATTRPAAPPPASLESAPVITNSVGQPPGAPDSRWLYARLHTHPERHDEIVADHLPALLTGELAGTDAWFLRYRSSDQTDHLRLRLRLEHPDRYGPTAAAVGAWAQRLRHEGIASSLVFDTYLPEAGRYGTGPVLEAAEAVFVADSTLAATQLRYLRTTDSLVLTAVNMIGIACDLLGVAAAMAWLITHPVPADPADRAVAQHVNDLMLRLSDSDIRAEVLGWPDQVTQAWQQRTAALAAYAAALPTDADLDGVLASLLHMHHNRARGIDRDGEATCLRLARGAALAWRARRPGAHQ